MIEEIATGVLHAIPELIARDLQAKKKVKGSVWETCYVAGVIALMFAVLIAKLLTAETVVFICMLLCWNARILTQDEALKGFSNSGMLAVGALFVVVKGVEKCQALDKLARKVFGVRSGENAALVRLCLLSFVLSAFFNNTPLVALFIPITRDWARLRGFSPSTYLMPMCHAVTMGGLLSMIGTSTNLVVEGLAIDAGEKPIGFFEPAYVAGPAGLIGILYMAFMAVRTLPKHTGLFGVVRDRATELLTEIEVGANYDLIGKPIALLMARFTVPLEALVKVRRPVTADTLRNIDVSKGGGAIATQSATYYKDTKSHLWGNKLGLKKNTTTDDSLTKAPTASVQHYVQDSETSSNYVDIFPVSAVEPIQAGDRIFIAASIDSMLDLQTAAVANPQKGLTLLDVDAVDLPGRGTDFLELVIGNNNQFVGKSITTLRNNFAEKYGASIIAVRRHNTSSSTNDELDLKGSNDLQSNVPVTPGDIVLVLAKDDFAATFDPRSNASGEFYLVSQVGKVPEPIRKRDYLPLVIFAVMLGWVTSEEVDMVQAAMAAIAALLITGAIEARKAVSYVDWGLLLLIGSAIGLSQAMSNSGLARYIGDGIKDAGLSAWGALTIMYLFNMVVTEILTNNAAAAITVPLGLAIAESLEVSAKPFIMAVLIASSASFMTPIGYQTNTMVWAPGNYSFADFFKLGCPLSFIYAVVAIVLIPLIWPF